MSVPVHRLLGRTQELHALRAAVASGPGITTVLGPGGIGKTRLVQELVAARTDASFISLSEARTEADVVSAITTQLGVRSLGGGPLQDIAATVERRGLRLIVLDNVEQIAKELAALLGELRRACPDPHWVCTSRHAVESEAEQTVRVGPLDREAAAELFLDRVPPRPVQQVTRGASLDRLLEGLDRIPLAIELAAPRLELLPLPELERRLSNHSALLRRPDGTEARHDSLDATMRWSWDLLAERDRSALVQLTTFRGGAPLEAIEAVVSLDGLPGVAQPLDALHNLVRASMVQRPTLVAGAPRFRLLETVRQFADGRWTSEAARSTVELRHAQWFADRCVRWVDTEDLEPGATDQLAAEQANLMVAAERLVADPREQARESVHDLVVAVHDTLINHMPATLHAQWLDAMLGPADELQLTRSASRALRQRLQLWSRMGLVDRVLGDLAAVRRMAPEATDPVARLNLEGMASASLHHHGLWSEAAAAARTVLRIGRAEGLLGTELMAEAYLAILEDAVVGRLEDADRRLRATWRRLERHELSGSRTGVWTGTFIGRLALERGELDEATRWAELCLKHRVALHDDEGANGERTRLLVLSRIRGRPLQLRAEVVAHLEQRSAAGPLHPLVYSALVVGLLALEEEDPVSFDVGLDWLRRGANTELSSAWTLQCRALCAYGEAAGLAAAGRPAEARAAWGRGRALQERVAVLHRPHFEETLDGLLELVACAEHDDAGAPEAALAALDRAVEALRIDLPGHTALVVLTARTLAERMRASLRAWRIAADGTWVVDPTGAHIDLKRRTIYARLLEALARQREREPGRGVSREVLYQVGWPEDRSSSRSLGNRLRVAMSSLRRAGVTLIERADRGYRLDPTRPIRLERRDARPPAGL